MSGMSQHRMLSSVRGCAQGFGVRFLSILVQSQSTVVLVGSVVGVLRVWGPCLEYQSTVYRPVLWDVLKVWGPCLEYQSTV